MGRFDSIDIAPVLREHVDPLLRDQFEQSRRLYDEFGEAGEPVNIRGTRLMSRVSPNASFGWFVEAGSFPTPDKDEFIEMKVFATRAAVGYRFSGDWLNQIDSTESFVRGAAEILSNYTTKCKKVISQALYGDGTGELGVVASRDTATQATFRLPTDATPGPFGARKVDKRARLNWYDSSTGTQRTTGGALSVVVSKVESTGVVTFDSTDDLPTDLVAGDIAVHEGSYNRAVLGLKRHVNNDSGVYQGQSRSTYGVLKAGSEDAGGTGISVAMLNRNKYAIRYRIENEAAVNVTLITSPVQWDLYSRLGFNLVRFNGGGGTFRQDFDKIQHGNSSWIVDVDCDDNRLYGIDTSCFKRYVLKPFGTFRDDGLDMRMDFASGAATDSYTGWLGVKFNLGCHKPNANFVIKNLSVAGATVGTAALG